MACDVAVQRSRGGVNDLWGIPIRTSPYLGERELYIVAPPRSMLDTNEFASLTKWPDPDWVDSFRYAWPLLAKAEPFRFLHVVDVDVVPPPTRWQRIKRAICRYALARWRDSGEDTRYWDGRAYSWRMLLPPPDVR